MHAASDQLVLSLVTLKTCNAMSLCCSCVNAEAIVQSLLIIEAEGKILAIENKEGAGPEADTGACTAGMNAVQLAGIRTHIICPAKGLASCEMHMFHSHCTQVQIVHKCNPPLPVRACAAKWRAKIMQAV